MPHHNRSYLVLMTAIACVIFQSLAWGQLRPTAAKVQEPGDEIVVPLNTNIPVELQSAISSRTAYVGQPIYCRTVYPVTVKDQMVIPVGSFIKGTIMQAVRPGRIRGKAQLGLRFDSLTLPAGVTKSFSGVLAGFAGNGKQGFKRQEGKIIGEGTKGRDAETVLVSGAEGAGIGSVAGISSGHSGAGAAVGGIGGALGGLVYVLATRGKEIVLPAGTDLQLQTTRPITFYRYQIQPVPDPNGPAFPKRDPGPGA